VAFFILSARWPRTLGFIVMTVPRNVKADWEKRFPDLSDKWTHWRLTGDGQVIALFPGERLLDALRFVEANCDRYTSIKCCRATADAAGNCAEVQDALFEISNIQNDQRMRNRVTSPGAGNEA